MATYGIEQTLDIIKFVDYIAGKMAEAMEDDGKIDTKEVVAALINDPDVAFSTIWGSWDIPAELSDLDTDEAMKLVSEVLPVIKKIVNLFLD